MLTQKRQLVYKLQRQTRSCTASTGNTANHLRVAPFKVVLGPQNSSVPGISVQGDEGGTITVQANGTSKRLRVLPDGTVSCRRKLKLQSDGSVVLEDGRAVPISISEDGTVSIAGRPAFTRRGDTLVDADPKQSFFGFAHGSIKVEGDPAANRLISASVAFCLTDRVGQRRVQLA